MPYETVQELIIRHAKPSDIKDIIRLCRDHSHHEKYNYVAAGKDRNLAELLFCESPRLKCPVVTSRDSGNLSGYATWSL
jgi:hypothetical protein